MERQIQKPGVRKWFADDFLKMQNQLYSAIEDALIGDIDNVVITGCNLMLPPPDPFNNAWQRGFCKIAGKLCVFDGGVSSQNTVYLQLQELETTDKEYADGITKPTEKHYKAILSETTNGGDEIVLTTQTSLTKQKLLLPNYDGAGNLKGLPKSNDYTNNSENILATLKAINDLYNLTNRKYVKENFDNGEIDQSLIPSGSTWLGKNGSLKLDANGYAFLEAIYATGLIDADTVAAVIIAGGTINGNMINSTMGFASTNGDINLSSGKIKSKSTPRYLIYVDANGNLINSLGEIEVAQVDIVGQSSTLFYLNKTIPSQAILITTVIGDQAAVHISADRYSLDTTKIQVTTLNADGTTGIASAFSLAIYY